MDLIQMARELGAALQKDELYLNLIAANDATEKDAELQKQIAQFSSLRGELNEEVMKSDERDNEKIAKLDAELRALYEAVTAAPAMIAYNEAKAALERKLNFISQIITGSANGQNPATIEEQQEGGCSGSCSTCGGCH